MITACASALLAGCGIRMTDSYCDVAKPHFFSSQDTVDWLLNNDRELLVDTTVHNETYDRLCGSE
jgi:hypothetical protein